MDALDLLTADGWSHVMEQVDDPQDKLNLLDCLHDMEDHFPDCIVSEWKMAASLMIFAKQNANGVEYWNNAFIKFRVMNKYIRSIIDKKCLVDQRIYSTCCEFIYPEKVEKCLKDIDSGTVSTPPLINGVLRCLCQYPAQEDEEEEEEEGEEEESDADGNSEDEVVLEEEMIRILEAKEEGEGEVEESDSEESNAEDADTEEDEDEASEEEYEEEEDGEEIYAPVERVTTLLSKIAVGIKKLLFIVCYLPSVAEGSNLIHQLLTSLPNLEELRLIFLDSSLEDNGNNREIEEKTILKLPNLRFIYITFDDGVYQEFPSLMPCPDLSQSFVNLVFLHLPLPLWKKEYAAGRLCFPMLRDLRLKWIRLGDSVDEGKIFKIFGRLEAPLLKNIHLMFANGDSSESEHAYFMKNIVWHYLKNEHVGKKCCVFDNIKSFKCIWFRVKTMEEHESCSHATWQDL